VRNVLAYLDYNRTLIMIQSSC